MILQSTYRQAEEIPEKFRELYTAGGDGLWRMTCVEGIVPAEERDRLENELVHERGLREKNEAVFQRAGITADQLENFIEGNSTMRSELETVRRKLEQDTVEKALTAAAAARGIRPEAVQDVLARGKDFKTEANGNVTLAGKTVDVWLDEQLKSAPHWLPASRSANARNFFGTPLPRPVRETPTISEIISKTWNNQKG